MGFNIIIPARKGSKGLPGKNRILLDYTLSKIPKEYHKKVIVSTDDDYIVKKIQNDWPSCKIHLRSKESALDTASTKQCLEEVIDDFSLQGDVVMLYLTYPEREWREVEKAYNWFVSNEAESLLCREPIDSHPYLYMYELANNQGEQLIKHELYRRQDYPKCFKICHMISIFSVKEFKFLNKNLYNHKTLYYKIDSALDVDTLQDFRRIRND